LRQLFLALLFAVSPALKAASGSESKACDSLNEGWNCSTNCWEKAKGPCADGTQACQANSKACGSGADSAASWGAVALYGAGALALLAVAWYFVDKAMDEEASLGKAETVETAADLDLLPTRALPGGA